MRRWKRREINDEDWGQRKGERRCQINDADGRISKGERKGEVKEENIGG